MAHLTISIDLDASRVKSEANQTKRSVQSIANVDFKELDTKLSSLRERLSAVGAAFSSFLGNLAADAIVKLIGLLQQGAAAWLDYASKLEQTKIAFTSLLGSGEKANKLLQEIQQFAKSTPFEFAGLAQVAQRFVGVNVEASKVIPLMRDIGNIVAATGETTQERLSGVANAISQSISKQKASAEEMEQLAEKGIPAWNLLAEALGKPQAEVRKLAEQGKISSDVMIAALQKISREKYGDAMEKQSKTFAGAMSNIKDSVLIAANTAFAPLYQKISSLAVDAAAEIERQNGDFEKIGGVIAEYVGKGLAFGVEGVIEWVISYTSRRITEFFTEGKIFTSIGSSFLSGVTNGIFEGLGYKSLGKEINEKINPQMKTLIESVKKTNSQIEQTPSLAKKLDAQKAAADAEKLNKILSETLRDLSLQIRFYRDETQVAATKQQLLRQGITDFSSGMAKLILDEAAYLDTLKEKQKAQEDFNSKFNAFGDEVRQIREDAEFKLKFVNPSELDEFNRKVNQSGLEFKGLAFEINQTREALRLLALSREYDKAGAQTKQFTDSVKESIEQLSQTDASPFQNKLQELLKGIELFTVAGEKLNNAGIAQVIEGKILNFRRDLDKLEDWASAAIGDPDLIQQKLKEKTQGIVDSWYADFINYMRSIRQKVESNGQIDFTAFFEGTEGNFETAQQLIGLFNSVNRAANTTTLNNYKSVISDLDSQIAELNGQLSNGVSIKQADAVATLMQSEAYQKLTPEMQKTAIEKAKEIDGLRASLKAQEEYREAFEKTADLFEDALTKIIEGDWKGLFDGILSEMKRFLVRAAAEWLTSKFFKLISGQNSGSGASSGGGFFDIFKNIFNQGGGSSGGGLFGSGNQGNGVFSFGSGLTSNSTIQNTLVTPDGKTFTAGGGGFFSSGIFAPQKNLLTGKTSALAGQMAGIGAIMSMAGGFLPGKAGGVVSMAGTGMSIGAMFGPWGAAAGAVIGGLVGLFGGDPKRKRDKNEKLPELNKGFADAMQQLRALGADKNAFYRDPEGTIAKAVELRGQIASGFGIQFESKKYQRESQKMIAAKLAEADAIIAELNKLKDRAMRARDVDTRLQGNFAGGVYMSPEFAAQYGDFKRRNGMLRGAWTGKDTLPSMLAMGEMVLNPMQINRVIRAAGRDVFKDAQIPGYASGTYIAPSPSPNPSPAPVASPAATASIVMQPNVTIIIEGEGMTAAKVKDVMLDGLKSDSKVQVQLVETYDKTKLRTR